MRKLEDFDKRITWFETYRRKKKNTGPTKRRLTVKRFYSHLYQKID